MCTACTQKHVCPISKNGLMGKRVNWTSVTGYSKCNQRSVPAFTVWKFLLPFPSQIQLFICPYWVIRILHLSKVHICALENKHFKWGKFICTNSPTTTVLYYQFLFLLWRLNMGTHQYRIQLSAKFVVTIIRPLIYCLLVWIGPKQNVHLKCCQFSHFGKLQTEWQMRKSAQLVCYTDIPGRTERILSR